MKNLMAKSMTERYAEYFRTIKLEEKGSKIIYWWVMSTLESYFWGYGRNASFTADLYASEEKIFLVIHHPRGEEIEFIHYPSYNTSNGKLFTMLKNFVEMFNNIEYTFISSPIFNTSMFENTCDMEKYNGYYYIMISVNMLPDADDDPANHGKHA